MAGSFSDYTEDAVLDQIFGGQTALEPATIYAAACTSAVTDSMTGSTITECDYTSYARVAITANQTNFPAASGGAIANGTAITFPASTGGADDTVTYIALCDASSAGNLLGWADLDASKVVGVGDTLEIAVGDLDITLA